MKSIPPKGLHDIKTSVRVGIGTPKRGQGPSQRVVPPRKTWAFSTKPKLARYEKVFEKALLVEKLKEPHTIVSGESDDLVVIAEMPGAKKETVSLEVVDDILILSADAVDSIGPIKYTKEILLPFVPEESSIKPKLKNGILEVKFLRKGKGKTGKRKEEKHAD